MTGLLIITLRFLQRLEVGEVATVLLFPLVPIDATAGLSLFLRVIFHCFT